VLPVQAEAAEAEITASLAIRDSATETNVEAGQGVIEVVQIAPSPVTDDSAVETSAPPALAEAQGVEIAPSPVIDDSASDTCASADEEVAEVVHVAPFPVTDDSAAETGVPPALAETQGVEIAPSPVTDDSAADNCARAGQEVAEVVQIAPLPVTDDCAAETSAPPARAEAESVENAPRLILNESTAGCSASPVQGAAEQEVPPSLRVPGREEEPPAPSWLDFYGLSAQPFDVTPDPQFLYLSPTHREALTQLAAGIQNLRGFMALISPPGLGKTTLLNKLMDDLRDSARVVFLFQTQCNSRELLRYLLAELGVEEAGKDAVGMHKALNEILFQEMLKGRRFVLIVDEAQNLQDSVLETVRLLSDFETTHSKLIQIVLSGQPQLAETLKRPNLSQLRQRIAVVAKLKPLSVAEAGQYINHRLRAAGANGKLIFTPDALTLIGERSNGIPRMINNFCFNALLLGCSEGGNPIDSKIVWKAVVKSDWESLVRQSPAGYARH
jgi:general secretion pathway protein A